MKRALLSLLVLGSLSLSAVAGCGAPPGGGNTAGSSPTGSQSQAKTSALGITAKVDANASPASGTVIIAVDNTYPPMEYMDPNNPADSLGLTPI